MISFLQPWVLVALVAASIPALLHLMGRRLPPLVVFPAVRYLTATEREHSRRIRLRNLLLLLLRTLVIVLLVLAAARPVLRMSSGPSHAPTAVALVVDNSLSSGMVVEGTLVLEQLIESARTILRQLSPGDHLWIVLADGEPRRTTRIEFRESLDSIHPVPVRLDLGRAVRVASGVVKEDPLPDKLVVVLSDLQASALSVGEDVSVPVVAVTGIQTVTNRWVDSAYADPEVWSGGGRVIAAIGATDSTPSTVRLTIASHDVDRVVTAGGNQVALSGAPDVDGWLVASVGLDPDELRADDIRYVPLFESPMVGASSAPGAGRFVADALEVLQQGGRVSSGREVTLSDGLADGTVVLFPPDDPALVGSVNRSLEASGIGLRFGDLLVGEWLLETAAGWEATVLRRHRLVGDARVLATVGDESWLVRAGNVVMVGSRMEPAWTDLPTSAQFVPFVDFLVNRVAAREVWLESVVAGQGVLLPSGSVELLGSGGPAAVPADLRMTAPNEPGVYFLRGAAGDTIGALAVNPDARESRPAPADDGELRAALGSTVTTTDRGRLGGDLFGSTGRADLTGLLLLLAFLVVLAEFGIAGSSRAGREVL